jgi:glycogen(starch) synthase
VRILVVTNFFPPHYLGGYELACGQVVGRLRARGDDVGVLTSVYGVGAPARDDDTFRWLAYRPFEGDAPRWKRVLRAVEVEWRNRRALQRAVEVFRPELVYFWNLTSVSLSAVHQVQRARLPTAFYVHDSWLARFPSLDPWYRASNVIVSRREPSFRHTQFASPYLKEQALAAGRDVRDGKVIRWGVDTAAFSFRPELGPVRRLLYAGQIEQHKGVETAVEALALAKTALAPHRLTLTIVGRAHDSGYLRRLERLVDDHALGGCVEFRGLVPHEELPSIYQAHDALLFPSRSPNEGLPLSLLEAMASGIPVVGTVAGGARDLLSDGVNALTFPIADAGSCADRIGRLVREEELAERLRCEARRQVEKNFELTTTVEHIARDLEDARHS